MSQKGVKECSAGFQPAEGLLQTKSLPSSTCRQDAGATISSRLLSPARRFAPETRLEADAEAKAELPRPTVPPSRLYGRDPAEVAAIGVSVRVVEVRRVAQVERLRAELQIEPLSELECSE